MPNMNFYNDCVTAFHKVGQEHGYLPNGLIFIPELLEMGQQYTLDRLRDQSIIRQFGHDPVNYHYTLAMIIMHAGIRFADQWHEDYSVMKDLDYVQDAGHPSFIDEAAQVVYENITDDRTEWGEFRDEVFNVWCKLMEPKWKKPDCREEVYEAMTAMFQLGVSIILNQYGY